MTRRKRGPQRRRGRQRPYYNLSVVGGVAATAVFFFALYQATTWHPYIVWIVALSGSTALLFLIDKSLSKVSPHRVPENVLHLFTLAGGFPGQLIGLTMVNHKSNTRRHPYFLPVFFISLIIHGLIGYIWLGR